MSVIAIARQQTPGSALIMTVALCVLLASPVVASSLLVGQSIFAVVVRGTGSVVESGRVTAIDGGMSRVRWDACACETHVPVDDLLPSPVQARSVAVRHDSARVTFAEAAGSAGRMSLLFLLFGRPVRR